jgi:hypothetical protein
MVLLYWLTLAGSPAPCGTYITKSTYRISICVMAGIITPLRRNINLLSIDYAFRPHLRTGSPWDDLRCPGNLGFTADGVLTRRHATYTYILTSVHSTIARAIASTQYRTLRYHQAVITDCLILSFGTTLKPRYIFGAPRLDQ